MSNHWPSRSRPMPDDFVRWARLEGTKKLQVRFGTSQSTVERWRRESGIAYVQPPTPAKARAKAVAVRRIRKRAANEAIEDLEDFGLDAVFRGLGARREMLW